MNKNPFRRVHQNRLQSFVLAIWGKLRTMTAVRTFVILALGGVVTIYLLRFPLRFNTNQCAISFGSYHGNIYKNKDTLETKCLVESKFMKLQQHAIIAPRGESVIDDWLWIDYHDRINVLVEDERKPGEESKFLVFEQSKYALEDRTSLAIVGGIIEPGEDALTAAKREVEEETGTFCSEFHFLGRFRTDVNRGMGWVNSFLATDCHRHPSGGQPERGFDEEVGVADMEQQRRVTTTLSELRQAAKNGDFLEVQWSLTVSLALLHLEDLK